MIEVILITGLFLNFIIAHLVGRNGKNRRIGYETAFFVSFFLSPIIGLLLVLSSKELSNEELDIINQKELQKKKTSSSLSNVLFYGFLILIFGAIVIILLNR